MSKNKSFMVTMVGKRNFRFYPVNIKGREWRKAKGKQRLISIDDAIKTTWMILEGIGYLRTENPKLEITVSEVFNTAPIVEQEG